MIKKYRGISIRGISAAVPRAGREIEDRRAIKNTGIERVRVTDENTTASDLCFAAASRLLPDLGVVSRDIDGLVFVSPTPDYLTPPSSHILQDRLGIMTATPCFDLSFGCSGYIYGLMQAAILISSGTSRRVLVMTGETTTKILRPGDSSTNVLFGDAGSATIVEAAELGTMTISVNSDGSGHQHIVYPNSALRKSKEEKFLKMDGAEVFNFARARVPLLIKDILDTDQRLPEEMDWYVFHQANKMIIDFIVKKLGIEPGQLLWSIKNFGNTGAASIPLSIIVDLKIWDAQRKNVLLCGFGVGLSWGAALVDLSATHFSNLIEV